MQRGRKFARVRRVKKRTGGGRARSELTADRTRYLGYLTELSTRLTDDAVALRNWMLTRHPDPAGSNS